MDKPPPDAVNQTPLNTMPPNMRWMWLLVTMPLLSDIVETGGLPSSPREWITEATVGLLIALLVRRVLQEHRQVLALARSDALTGLWNRRVFNDMLEDECARARRSASPLALVYVDLDNFKTVNDSAGHAVGDQVLCHFASAVRHAVRDRVDRGFRIGGDEFALLLPGSEAQQAEAVVDRIRAHCGRAHSLWVDGSLGMSAGVVVFDVQETGADFVRRADAAMYQSKRDKLVRLATPVERAEPASAQPAGAHLGRPDNA